MNVVFETQTGKKFPDKSIGEKPPVEFSLVKVRTNVKRSQVIKVQSILREI